MKKAPEIFQRIARRPGGSRSSSICRNPTNRRTAWRSRRWPRNASCVRCLWSANRATSVTCGCKTALARPSSEPIAANVIQMWLMGTQSPLLCDFLDSLGIPHDEKGGIDSLPESPAPERLQAAVDGVLAKFPPDVVSIYLNSFQSMDIAGWPGLEEILKSDSRLQFGAEGWRFRWCRRRNAGDRFSIRLQSWLVLRYVLTN